MKQRTLVTNLFRFILCSLEVYLSNYQTNLHHHMNANDSLELQLETFAIKKGLKIFSGVNSELRQEILDLIHKKGQMTVTQLYTELSLEQPITSNHLAILRNTGMVNAKRIGKNVFYSINYSRLEFLHHKSQQLLDFQKGPEAYK